MSKEEVAKHEQNNHVTYAESMNLGKIPQSSNQVQMENATFYCKHCGNSFEEFRLLAKHSIGELLGVTCGYCGDTLADNNELEKHNEDVHESVKCKTTISRSLLKNHMVENHPEEPVNTQASAELLDIEEENLLDSQTVQDDPPSLWTSF